MLTGVNVVLLLLVMANLTAVAAPLEVVRHEQLVTALSYQTEIANNLEKSQAPYMVRVYEVPTVIEECWGKIESCPDHLLYITASERDLNARKREKSHVGIQSRHAPCLRNVRAGPARSLSCALDGLELVTNDESQYCTR